MKKAILAILCLSLAGALAAQTKITLWTQEGTAEDAFAYVQKLAADYSAASGGKVSIEVVNKETEVLREDFITSSLAGNPPDLLWTVNDHAGPFVEAGIIQPVTKFAGLTSKYATSALAAVQLGKDYWGVPVSNGNHLMLYYNKKIIDKAPENTNELIAVAGELNKKGIIPLVWNQTEPFWLVPWLGGFRGKVFAADGVTPTLDTPAMVGALQLLHDLKYRYKVYPLESNYDTSDTLFKEGKAAMIINGDWTLGAYKAAFGDNLGIARIPMVSSTRVWPAPYTSGKFLMIPVDVTGAKLEAVKGFIEFATNKANQLELVKKLARLPANREALADPLVTQDPYLRGSAQQMLVGTPMPTVVEMRANWDAMKPEMNKFLADPKGNAAATAKAMQEGAIAALKALK
jgi:arabinogalactan oligomer/maltooligosaccharide transport system substrate-binding protein